MNGSHYDETSQNVSRGENRGASNVNEAPLLATDTSNFNLTRYDEASSFQNYNGNINDFKQK